MNRLFGIHTTDPAGPQGPAGSLAIGTTVTDGTAECLLFVGEDGKLAQQEVSAGVPGLGWNASASKLFVSAASNDVDNGASVNITNAPTNPGSKAWLAVYCFGVGGDAYVEFYDNASSSDFITGIDSSDSGAFVISKGGSVGAGNVLRADASTGVITLPSLAGTGSRTVVADANGVLSAP